MVFLIFMEYERGKKRLPIEAISDKEFQEFMKKELSKSRLGTHELQGIYRLFGLDDSDIATIPCEKDHGHDVYCQKYTNRQSAVVSRLIHEVRRYSLVLRRLESEISGS
jgi:hypothetical protein